MLATSHSFLPVTRIRRARTSLGGLLRPLEISLRRTWVAPERQPSVHATPSFGVPQVHLTFIRCLESRHLYGPASRYKASWYCIILTVYMYVNMLAILIRKVYVVPLSTMSSSASSPHKVVHCSLCLRARLFLRKISMFYIPSVLAPTSRVSTLLPSCGPYKLLLGKIKQSMYSPSVDHNASQSRCIMKQIWVSS